MRIQIVIILLLNCFLVYGQNEIIFKEPLKIQANEKISPEIKKGTILNATSITEASIDATYFHEIVAKDNNGSIVRFDARKINQFEFKEIDNTDKFWDKNLLLHQTYINLLTKGMQHELRNELNNEALEYITTLNKYNQFFEDEYFEDYMYTLVNKIHKGILRDKRPSNIYLKILKDPEPSAFIFSNGFIVVTTGLLSNIQSEDELVGVLAHEIAHFALDHHLINYSKEVDRQKRAQFWATFATVVAAGADVYLTVKNDYHIPGILTASTAAVSTELLDEISTRLGVKYNHEQEIEADKVAKEVLGVLNYDKMGLSAALTRIKNYCINTGNYNALLSSGTHPHLDERISALEAVINLEQFNQKSYSKKVSHINSYNAAIELWQFAHPNIAFVLAGRNINLGLATESDYLIKAIIKRRSSNTKESNEEVLDLLNKAKALNITSNCIIYKEEGITLIRLARKNEARKAFESYLNLLNEAMKKDYMSNNIELENEIIWTKTMLLKLDSL